MSKRTRQPETKRATAARALLVTLAVVACAAPLPTIPADAATGFIVDDPELARELAAAADDWAVAGLEIANYVTVNQEPRGVRVELVTRERLIAECRLSSPYQADGCSSYSGGRYKSIWIPDDLTPERLAAVLRHELIHCLVPGAEHLPDSVPAVFSEHASSNVITDADMLEMARHTDVVLVHPWPLSAAAEPRCNAAESAHRRRLPR